MKVKELVEKYNKNNRMDIARAIETKEYVGIELKRKLANLVLDNCITDIDGELHIDSVERYILFTIAAISMHTNLEFSDEDNEEYSAIDDYDMLCETGLLIKVIDTFKDDYASCQEILNMMTADKLQYSMTLEKKLGQLLDGIQDFLGDTISGMVDKLNIDGLSEEFLTNPDKLSNLIDLIK